MTSSVLHILLAGVGAVGRVCSGCWGYHNLGYLDGELPGGDNYHRLEWRIRRGTGDGGHEEGDGLSRPCLCVHHDVLALGRGW